MKKVSVHRRARQEVSEVIAYLDEKAGERTGDAFFAEVMTVLESLQTRHGSHHFFSGDIRRVNLKRFRYHVLYPVHQSMRCISPWSGCWPFGTTTGIPIMGPTGGSVASRFRPTMGATFPGSLALRRRDPPSPRTRG